MAATRKHILLVSMAVSLVACGASRPAVSESSWPEADRLFRSDPRWLGGDGAYSVDLGGGRSLWLFGDSFVATSDRQVRAESVMVRNSVAVQQGTDPTSASIEFHWRELEGRPASFFPDGRDHWFWPAHGILLDDTLTLFLARVCPDDAPDSLGFRGCGFAIVRTDTPTLEPLQWELRDLEGPTLPFEGVVGVSTVSEGDHVYAFVVEEPGSHDLYLMRWGIDAFVAGRLTEGEWWCGAGGGFVAGEEASPAVVIEEAATELSVSRAPDVGGFVQVQSRGFGDTTIALRFAERLEGPWTDIEDVFRPPESGREGVLVYAGKGHPQLQGADLVVTYAANAFDFTALVEDDSLYYPRFVRLDFSL